MDGWILLATTVAFAVSATPASSGVIFEIGPVTAAWDRQATRLKSISRIPASVESPLADSTFKIFADSDIDFAGGGFSTSVPYIFGSDSFDQVFGPPLNTTTVLSLSAGDISNSGDGDVLGAGRTAGLGW
jgi:hypothetical protein